MNLKMIARLHSSAVLAVAALLIGASQQVAFARGPNLNPVRWMLTGASPAVSANSPVLLHLHADIAAGYHLYSFTTPDGGPIRTTLTLPADSPLEDVRIYQPPPDRHNDSTLNVPVETFSNTAEILVEAKVKKSTALGSVPVIVKPRYQACSDQICLPPVERTIAGVISVQGGGPVTKISVPPTYRLVSGSPDATMNTSRSKPAGSPFDLKFLLIALGVGFATIFTPCVFPTVPLTISYFLQNGQKHRSAAIRQGALFSGGIILLFATIGGLVTLIAGPFGVVQLASSPWVNGFVAIVFFALGLSLLGAFELTLPSRVLTSLDGLSRQSGIAGGLLLGLTFCLTSFACVGPFLGTLLAASVQTSGWQPLLGMLAFATGLALPFFVLSLFPSFLKRLPKSGAWLARVKVVFGFVILAVALKYLASVDQMLQWNLLTRERFVAIWFALFLMAALYLWGQLRLQHAQESSELGLGRLLAGAGLLAFAVSLLPALWGSKLGELESFLPPASMSSLTSQSEATAVAPVWLKNNYQGALAEARRQGKPLLISFSGYACTNCHWMKANVFPRPEIAAALRQYVLLELYTDGTDAASRENQQLEQSRFSTVALPYYTVLDPSEKQVASQAGLTRKPEQFLSFLQEGVHPMTSNASL